MKAFIIAAAILILWPLSCLAESMEIRCNRDVGLTICEDPWPYAFDCTMDSGTRCDFPNDRASFNGWPPCTPESVRTGSVFRSREYGKIHIIRWESSEIRFIGRYNPGQSPRKFRVGELVVTVVSVR